MNTDTVIDLAIATDSIPVVRDDDNTNDNANDIANDIANDNIIIDDAEGDVINNNDNNDISDDSDDSDDSDTSDSIEHIMGRGYRYEPTLRRRNTIYKADSTRVAKGSYKLRDSLTGINRNDRSPPNDELCANVMIGIVGLMIGFAIWSAIIELTNF